jgi:hypothetical protein
MSSLGNKIITKAFVVIGIYSMQMLKVFIYISLGLKKVQLVPL